MMRKSIYVVDTNVPIVANGDSNVSDECISNCITALKEIIDRGRIAIDDLWLIIDEYKNKLSQKGQPGVGDAFLKWVLTNRKNIEICKEVKITPLSDDKSDFVEYPNDPELAGFDPSDRKFVAVALADSEKPPILQAVDSDWWQYRIALKNNDITVIFLCKKEIKEERRTRQRRQIRRRKH